MASIKTLNSLLKLYGTFHKTKKMQLPIQVLVTLDYYWGGME